MFRAHVAPPEVCDNLINALKLLAKQQIDGCSPVKMVVQGLQERSPLRKMDMFRKFFMVDRQEGGVEESGEAGVHDRLPGSCGAGRSG